MRHFLILSVALLGLSSVASGITVPITTLENAGAASTSYSTNFNLDSNWKINGGNAYVFTASNKKPFSDSTWPVATAGQWISPSNTLVNGNHMAPLSIPTNGQTWNLTNTFVVPTVPNTPAGRTWVYISGTYMADDRITGVSIWDSALTSQLKSVSWAADVTQASTFYQTGTFLFSGLLAPGTYNFRVVLQNTRDTAASDYVGANIRFTQAYATPEPGAWALMLTSGAVLAFASRRRRKPTQTDA